MKFLCTGCDSAMKLKDAVGPDRGSVALIYACESCGTGFAMLTNPHETQAVTSLGVDLGPSVDPEFAAAASKCPFNGMLQQMGVDMTAEHPAAAESPPAPALAWTEAARSRLDTIPSFVRPMAVDGIESYARDKGYAEIDEQVLDEVREHFI